MILTKELKERTPLIRVEWIGMLNKIAESKNAPVWNTQCGDRLTEPDMLFVKSFEKELKSRKYQTGISENIKKWILKIKKDSIWFGEKIDGFDIEKEFCKIPFMTRSDLQLNIEQIVPSSISLNRLIVNPTSGTTGQPILCPNHPSSIGCYDPMIQFVLSKHGAFEIFDYNKMAAIQVCAQQKTITYFTVHSFLNGAGFAKINLMVESEWPQKDSPSAFIKELKPVLLSGDPFAFYYALKTGVQYQPKALLSTAITLSNPLRKRLEQTFNCPVINFYSLNETGPLAYSCPLSPDSFHILPHDIYIEIIDKTGKPVKDKNIGEIIVTGGRNPYIPLLRYKTGDFGAIERTPCKCGDPFPRFINLNARKPVLFFDQSGQMVNPIDISRILRNYPVIGHQMVQKKNTDCILNLAFRFFPGDDVLDKIRKNILELFNNKINLALITNLDTDKTLNPFICEIEMMDII